VTAEPLKARLTGPATPSGSRKPLSARESRWTSIEPEPVSFVNWAIRPNGLAEGLERMGRGIDPPESS
jgi:hypothetical protein